MLVVDFAVQYHGQRRLPGAVLGGQGAAMRAAYGALTLLFASCVGCAHFGAMSEPTEASFDGRVLEYLASIQREFRVETVHCLTGWSDGSVVRVQDIRLSGVTRSEPQMAEYVGCHGPDIMGMAHNHPTGACQFSPADNATFMRKGYRVALVSCAEGFRWRTLTDSGHIPWRSR